MLQRINVKCVVLRRMCAIRCSQKNLTQASFCHSSWAVCTIQSIQTLGIVQLCMSFPIRRLTTDYNSHNRNRVTAITPFRYDSQVLVLGKSAKHPFLLRFTNSCVSKGNKAKHPFLMWFTLFHCVLTVFHCVVSTRSENHSFSLSFHCVLCRQSQQSTPFPLSLASEAYWLWAKEDGTNCADAVDIDRKTCMGGRNANSWLLYSTDSC